MVKKDYYHTITYKDCLSVASPDHKARLSMINDYWLLHNLAMVWCDLNGYKLGNYLGKNCWDATLKQEKVNA